MSGKFITTVALRYFVAKKSEKFVSVISAISLLGIMLGVAALIIVMSVMHGFHVELTKNIIGLNGDISARQVGGRIQDYQPIIEHIQQQDYVTRVNPVIVGQSLAVGAGTSGVLIKGIDLAYLKHKKELVQGVVNGDFADYQGKDAIAIGSNLASQLGVGVGDQIKLVSANTISTAFGTMPRAKDFKVQVIFNSGMYDYDNMVVLMPLVAARLFLSHAIDEVNWLEIYVRDQEQAGTNAYQLMQLLGSNWYITSWGQDNQQFLQALQVERTAMFTILSLIMVVAAFNILSSLFMLVKDKTKDIAILKTIGANRSQIMLIFMCNGMLVGVIGTLCGVGVGLLLAYNIENIRLFLESASGVQLFEPAIYFLYNLPSIVRAQDVISVAGMAFIVSLLATLYPAYKAASLNPVEAMRYE